MARVAEFNQVRSPRIESCRRQVVRRTGAKRLSLSHRLGITLVILGMVQVLMPTWYRPTRPTLRLPRPLSLALADLESEEGPALLAVTEPTLPSESAPDQEPDQDSSDTEDFAETFAWLGATTDRRSVQGSTSPAPSGAVLKPDRAGERTRSALQRHRALPILADDSASMVPRLCRFLC
jgi:hypothetical protein